MSASGADAARRKSLGSAHLGATLRSVLVAPSAGFHAALRSTQRRARRGAKPVEGLTPWILSAIGGAAVMILWLKLAALAGFRAGSAAAYEPSFLLAALGVGAALGTIAQAFWGVVAARVLDAGEEPLASYDARLVWGASFFPQVFTVALLLPIDLLVTGPAAFTEARPSDPVGAGWAALSLALGVALALWSLGLFAKGLEVATGVSFKRAYLGTLMAAACLAALGVGFRFGLVAVAEMMS